MDEQVKEEVVKKPREKKPKVVAKPKHKTTNHTLLVDVQIGDKLVKKSTKYPLTVQGVKYFKSKFYIK